MSTGTVTLNILRNGDANRVVNAPHAVSLTALAGLQQSLTGNVSGKALRTRRHDVQQYMLGLAESTTPFGKLFDQTTLTVGDEAFQWHVVNPFALLFALCTAAPVFGDLLRESMNGGIGRLALYFDEVKPGNVLRPDKGRSLQCVYWTLMDLPDWFRSRG